MARKKPFALRLNPEVLQAIQKWAEDEFRSTNGQIEWMLQRMLQKEGRLKKPTTKGGADDKDRKNKRS